MSPPVKPTTISGPAGATVAPSGAVVAVDTVTVVGARGGSGTSTMAAELALTGRTMVRTELVTGEPAQLAALIGVDIPVGTPVEILPGLRLAREPSGTAELTVIDVGHLGVERASRRSGEQRLGVVRGPCYLAVRAVVDGGRDLDGLVLVAERGRALTERDVSDATRLDIVATIPVDPAIARAIDAGLLATRATHQRQLQPLQRWLTDRLDPFPRHVSAAAEPARASPSKIDTDLPGAQSAPGGVASTVCGAPFVGVLNIGKLSPGAAEYYVGEIASSAEDYYTGRGEAKGRWVGSLRPILGLWGEVDPEHFRRVLAGDDPFTGEHLVSSQGSAGRAAARRGDPVGGQLSAMVDSARAAAYLGLSHQHVRRLLKAGAEYEAAQAEAEAGATVIEPRRYLVGERVTDSGKQGGVTWRISRAEVERLAGQRPAAKPRPGYDVTLRPPKSVSVLWALSSPEVRAEIRQVHTEAVDEAVRYLEDRAVRARLSGKAGRYLAETDGVIAAAFDHRTSRAGDPLLHTHVVVANMTRLDTPDGPAWRAVAAHGLFEHAKAAGHLYQGHFRHELVQRLGVQWGPVVNGYADLAGVPVEVIEVFSKRRTEITEVLAESGHTSAKAAQIATLDTRQAKHYQVDPDTLFAQWRSEAEATGFTPSDAAACLHQATPEPLTTEQAARLFAELAGPTGLTERASVFHRSDVIEAIACRAGAACTAAEIEALADQFLTSDACVVVDNRPGETAPTEPGAAPAAAPRRLAPTQTAYTAVELAAVETEILTWANDTGSPRSPALPTEVVQATVDARPELSAEQTAMVQAVCGHEAAIELVAGRPGAGKTYATEAIVAAHVAAGVPIVGCAVSATAAAELEQAAGFARSVMPATTVAKLLLDLDRWGGLAPAATVIVDETSMLATRDLHRLAGHTRRAGGSVVLVGDPDQHGAVEVGGVFQRLCQDRGDRLVRLVDNNRQVDETDRLAIAEYRDGHINEALSRLDNAGRVIRSATAGESFDAMVADWYTDHQAGRADPMIAGPNSTRRALNDRARILLKQHGELTGQPVIVAGREYLVGDLVVARRNDRRLRATADGDFVKNGSAGTITAVHTTEREVTVAFEREGTIRVPHAYLAAGRLEHGYARTSYGVQGATHGTARYHPTDLSGFEEGYVALTRGRHANRLYIVDGTITHADDEAHQQPERQRFDLDDITSALARRRSGAMATDTADQLARVHALATRHTLAELGTARRLLDRVLALAPADATRAINQAATDLDALRARQHLHDSDQLPSHRAGQLDRGIVRSERRLTAAQAQQAERDAWMATNADVVDRHTVLVRAERHRRTRITADPLRFLQGDTADAAGPVPSWQHQRRQWRAVLVQQALAADLASGQPTADAESAEVDIADYV